MNKCLYILIFFFVSISFTNPIHAYSQQTPYDTIRVKYYLNPIIKTATKVADAQRDLAASISLIKKQTLMLAPTSAVLEVLQHHVPSLYVTEWGVMGFGVAGSSAGKISIRGMGGSANTHVLILRNGRPDFMGLMGCTIADEFSSDGVERVEIIRGPGSFLYGTNATGGIINIITKKLNKDGFETRLSGGYGTFDTRKLSISHGGKIGRFDYYMTANDRETDGHRQGSGYKGRHYTAHMGYMLTPKTSLEINANLADIVVRDPGQITDPKADNWYDVLRYGGDLNLVHRGRLGETNLKLHGNFGHHKFFDGWRSNDRTLGLMVYQNTKPWWGNTTTIGFDYKRYGGDALDASTDYGEFFITEYAPYIHMQQLFLNRFIASAGLRLEHHELYSNEILPKIGLVVHPTSTTSVRLSLAKGFRSPSIRELYFWRPANDELTPDRLWNYEVGITQNFGQRLQVEATVFRSEGKNLIQLSSPPPKWVNSGQYVHTGYEIILHYIPIQRLEMGASWSQIGLSEGVFNIPEKKLTAFANYSFWRMSVSGNLLFVKDLVGAEFPGPSPKPVLHPMDDYTVLTVSIQSRLFRFIELKLAIKNALDAEYQAMYGYPMPGRHVIIGVNYNF